MMPIRDFPWSVTALGAVVFTLLRYTAGAVAGWLGAPAGGTPLRTLPLTLLVGLILSAALTWVVLADGDGTTTARALRRAALFCVVPAAAVAGAAAAGSIDATRAGLGVAAVVIGSLVTATLVAARMPTHG
ncbi:MAG TPA: hypothetical protein VK420_02265 [Longimicrobium sp.]|nr:hypothetical protein [Longimicrobium sp.]